ncbi:hypothetical protein ACFQ9X_16725 [Catenulispora yoronensis]
MAGAKPSADVPAVMGSGPIPPPNIPPHVPMQPPTHPPTQVGETDPTRVVPAEFGGRGVAETEQAPAKSTSGSRISRRKLLVGAGGLAGVAVAGGGAYVALGSKKDVKTGDTTNLAAGSATTPSPTGSPSNADASGPSSSDSSSDADTASSSSSSSASESPSTSPSSAAGSLPPLTPSSVPVGQIELPGNPQLVYAFINGGKHLIVSDDANGVQIFDITNAAAALKVGSIPIPLADGKLQEMLSMDYSPARGLLVLGGKGGLYLWDVKDPTKPVQLSARGDVNGKRVSDLALSSDGMKLAIATVDDSTPTVGNCVLDLADPKQPAQISTLTPSDKDSLELVAFAAGDKYIVTTGHGEDSRAAIFQLWDAGNARNVVPINSASWYDPAATKLTGALYVATSGPWNTLVLGVSGADDQSQDMQFLDFRKPQSPAKQWKFTNISGALGFHPTHPVVVAGDSRSGAATIYDMTDPGHPLPITQLVKETGRVLSLGFNPDGSLLAMALRRSDYSDKAVIYFWKM